VDPVTLMERVNDAARDGYRLIAMSATTSSLVAIMERVEKPAVRYNYLAIPVRGTKSKYETPGKTKTELAEQINDMAAAKGYHLGMTFGNLEVMESNSDRGQHFQYALTSPGAFGYFKKDEISGLISAGYQWAATAGTIVIFERSTKADNPHEGFEVG